MSRSVQILIGLIGIAVAGLAFAGYAMPEMQTLLMASIPFCN